MATKSLLPNQHTPLHLIYGHNDCCLCNAEEEIQKLKSELINYKDLKAQYEQLLSKNQHQENIFKNSFRYGGKVYYFGERFIFDYNGTKCEGYVSTEEYCDNAGYLTLGIAVKILSPNRRWGNVGFLDVIKKYNGKRIKNNE